MRLRRWAVRLTLPVVIVACSGPRPDTPQSAMQHGGMAHGQAGAGRPVLYDTLGTYSYRITTASPDAQRWFDQGLRLVYAFNHHEAQRAFREAARLDPACAMCFWGVAITEGGNYNHPTDAEREKRALAAVQEARKRAAGARPVERALIEALARRHSADPAARPEALGRAYADAMRDVARQFPDDLEVATFFADAMMNLRPWHLWTPERTPHPGTEELIQALERAIARNPNHPGALHLYIHAVEAGPEPGRAEAAADRLLPLLPGAGHLVHMPSHIYWRVGRYADAVTVNAAAAKADVAYFNTAQPSPIYRGLYYPHNIDFIWQSASMLGRSAETVRAAREFADKAPPEMVKQMPDMETAPAAPIVALVRFGRWDEVLGQPAPPRDWPYARGVWHYARGLAFNGKGQAAAARKELGELEAILNAVPAERTVAFFFRARNMLQLAANVLAGEIAAKAGDVATAERLLRAAVAEQDTHWFTEPPPWYFPVRQALGAVLLQAGRAADAEKVYRDDLRQNPGNGWSLFGLAQSLRAQGKGDEASRTDEAFRKAWAQADVRLAASRF
ncbi:MAG TPA: tetratricopeptide repeat protein [Methylomirabilota bacterium]|nr:tetratricopeptide repeat protein [Methylomirabilota bacterium]